MKVSRALDLVGITLDELVQAIRAGNVQTRERWGKQELIRPHRWRQPPKPIEVLDQEVDVDRESLIETFGDPGSVPVNRKNAGRKPSGGSQGPEIIQRFLCLVDDGIILLDSRGRQKAARKLHVEFPDYSVKYIADLIAPQYRQLKNKRAKP